MRKLEEILNLPESKEITEQEQKPKKQKPAPQSFRDYSEYDKISAALPMVKDLGDASDAEFDELAEKATAAYQDLMDLGMNVEARFSARLFEVASTMLKNAIDAKSAKIDKKLKMVELQLKKQKLDNDVSDDNPTVISGDGMIVSDRNSLIEKLKSMNK